MKIEKEKIMNTDVDIVHKFKQKFELVSYLSDVLKDPSAVFKKEYCPPESIKESFYKTMSEWIQMLIKKSIGDWKDETNDGVLSFTLEETKVLKNVAAKLTGASTTSGTVPSVPTTRKSQPKSVNKMPNREMISPGSLMYLIDNSEINDPRIGANDKVTVIKDHGAMIEVQSVKHPIRFTTQYDNLSKEST